MGNLWCISCKHKDKKIQRSIGDLKGASFNQDVDKKSSERQNNENHRLSSNEGYGAQDSVKDVRFDESVDLASHGQRRTTATELYHILRSQRLKDDSSEEDNNLEDIEKAAKAIVDMSVFLTTQVIYPAYLRYLREDHPDAYTQFIQGTGSNLSLNNAITVGGDC